MQLKLWFFASYSCDPLSKSNAHWFSKGFFFSMLNKELKFHLDVMEKSKSNNTVIFFSHHFYLLFIRSLRVIGLSIPTLTDNQSVNRILCIVEYFIRYNHISPRSHSGDGNGNSNFDSRDDTRHRIQSIQPNVRFIHSSTHIHRTRKKNLFSFIIFYNRMMMIKKTVQGYQSTRLRLVK